MTIYDRAGKVNHIVVRNDKLQNMLLFWEY